MNVVVLGASGMVGSMVLDWLSQDSSLRIIATARDQVTVEKLSRLFGGVGWRVLDAERCGVAEIRQVLDNATWAVNAIGVLEPEVERGGAAGVERAIRVNALFPHQLAKAAVTCDCEVLQIASNVVYSGVKGSYSENDGHNGLSGYAKTSSLGEVRSANMRHLRCSIIGPEPQRHDGLLDRFRAQPPGSNVPGYTNQQWNGITSLHFARLCHGIIAGGFSLPHLQHIVPSGKLTNCELLRCCAWAYRREDVAVVPTEAETALDRTLATENGSLNRKLWEAAGYSQPPTVPEMVAELAAYDYRLERL